MEYEYIKFLKENSPSLKLIKADNAPLIISFLYQEYKSQNLTVVSNSEIIGRLSDFIFYLRKNYDDDMYPDTPQNYIDKWSNEGYLRKYYTYGSDEPVLELTPAVEKALEWIKDLEKKEFIGTESRLLKIFDLMKEIVYKTSDDPATRLKELEKERNRIDAEIEEIKAGNIKVFDATQIKERYFELLETSRKLLSDFRQIEYNFRELDKIAREKQINETISKGSIVGDIFDANDVIWETDQGKSFKSFWEFLMSREKQDEFNFLAKMISGMPEINKIKKSRSFGSLKFDLLDAGAKVNKTTHLIIEQLSSFLDDKSYVSGRRIIGLAGEIKNISLQIKNAPPKESKFFGIDDKPFIDNVMEKPLFIPPQLTKIEDIEITEGDADISTEALYRQFYIDKKKLKSNIRFTLKHKSQATLGEVIEKFPIEKGTSEIIAYLDIAEQDNHAIFDETKSDKIKVFNKDTGKHLLVQVPLVVFNKGE